MLLATFLYPNVIPCNTGNILPTQTKTKTERKKGREKGEGRYMGDVIVFSRLA